MNGTVVIPLRRYQRWLYRIRAHDQTLLMIGLGLTVILAGTGLAYIQVHFSPLLALVVILGLPLSLLILGRPEIGLLAVIFIIPFEDFQRVGGLPSTFSVIKLLSVAVVGAFLVHFAAFRRRERLVSAPQNLAITLLVIAAVISFLVSIDPDSTVRRIFWLLRIISLYVLVINLVRTQEDLHSMAWIMVISGFICALYGLNDYYFNPDVLINGRISGTMDDPNEFAGAMVARLPFVLCLFPGCKRPLARLLLVVTVPTILWGIILSGSRGGLLALALAALLFVAVQKRHRLLSLLIIVLLVPLILGIMPPDIKTRVGLTSETDSGAESSTEKREAFQWTGLGLFLEHPLIGTGLGTFAEGFRRSQYRFMKPEGGVVHNMYLEIAVETGLLGLVPFLYLLYATLRDARRTVGLTPEGSFLNRMANAFFIGFGGYLLVCLFLSEQYEKNLWLFVGLGVVLLQLARSEKERASSKTARPHITEVAGGTK